MLHGFDPQVLADLLLPRQALFEQPFDLTLGQRRLIGCPISLSAQLPVMSSSGSQSNAA